MLYYTVPFREQFLFSMQSSVLAAVVPISYKLSLLPLHRDTVEECTRSFQLSKVRIGISAHPVTQCGYTCIESGDWYIIILHKSVSHPVWCTV